MISGVFITGDAGCSLKSILKTGGDQYVGPNNAHKMHQAHEDAHAHDTH